MQPAKCILSDADYWHVRPVPHSIRGEHLLQFYADGHRKTPWEEYGLFFIINVEQSRPPRFEFKLGNYDEAKKKGVFRIKNYETCH